MPNTLKDVMDVTEITEKDLEQLKAQCDKYLLEWEAESHEWKQKEFIRLISADVAIRKIHEAFMDTEKEKLMDMIDKDPTSLLSRIVSIMGCFAMIGAHCGWMKEVKDDETKAN